MPNFRGARACVTFKPRRILSRFAGPKDGVGLALAAGGAVTNSGKIVGGAGGSDRTGPSGGGGAGVSLAAYGPVDNRGYIAGGAGGSCYAPDGSGGAGGVGLSLAAGGAVANYGTINGGAGGYGAFNSGPGGVAVSLAASGAVANHGAITGGAGGFSNGGNGYYGGNAGGAAVQLSSGGVVNNYGAVTGGTGGAVRYDSSNTGGAGGAGVLLSAGGLANNYGAITGGAGGAGHPGSTGAEGAGVYAGAGGVATVTNFGTIAGGVSVQFNNAGDRLIAEAGSTFIGAVQGGGGTLELADGSGTITGLGGVGVASGSVAMTFSNFGAYVIDAGAAWSLSGKNSATGDLTVDGTLTLADRATLTIQGNVINNGQIVVAASTHATSLIIGKTGAMLSGGGTVTLGGKTFDHIIGATLGATLTNADNTIAGSGQIGLGKMVLVNAAAGVIEQTGTSLTIDTGSRRIINDGLIEATGLGGLTIAGSVLNLGLLETRGGNLTVDGAVAGGGSALIGGGVLTIVAAFNQHVSFTGSTGELALGDAQGFHGKITGFSTTGATSMDLRDIGFVSASEASFSGTRSGGVLTVTDGTHTAHITLVGNYTGSTWTCSSDGAGGVVVIDRPAANLPRAPSPSAFVAIMAGLGAGAASASVAMAHLDMWRPTLMAPRAQLT